METTETLEPKLEVKPSQYQKIQTTRKASQAEKLNLQTRKIHEVPPPPISDDQPIMIIRMWHYMKQGIETGHYLLFYETCNKYLFISSKTF